MNQSNIRSIVYTYEEFCKMHKICHTNTKNGICVIIKFTGYLLDDSRFKRGWLKVVDHKKLFRWFGYAGEDKT